MDNKIYNPLIKFSYLILWLSLVALGLCAATDRITTGNSISGDKTIVSANGKYELGFFQPSGKVSKYYIGLWYKKVSTRTAVWVANRVNPVSDKNSYELKLLNGNLVLTNGSNSPPIWSTTQNSSTAKSIEAVLLDSGNLVLRDGPNTSQPLWQSFDHPTDTFMTGSKVAYNKKTKETTQVTSWKNQDDPAPGLYTLELDHVKRQYILLWNKTKTYWTSGSWDDDQKIFSLVPEMRLNFLYNFSYVDNENESYFTFDVINPETTSRLLVDASGLIQVASWVESSQQWNLFWTQPKQPCQVYAYCGAFGSCSQNLPACSCLRGFEPKSSNDWGLTDYSGGCIRKTPLSCGMSNAGKGRDRFLAYPSMSLPESGHNVEASSLQECESYCLNNCSCNAYSYDGKGCSVWFGEFLNLQQLSNDDPTGKTLNVRLSATEFSSKSIKKRVVGGVVGAVLILVVLGLGLTLCWKRRVRAGGSTKAVEGSLIAFRYKELQTATKNFTEKLGGGGFGSVFKGILPDSSVIAVKKLESFSQGEKQFRTEVSTIGTVQHVNLVRLRGFCSEGAKKLLVYDYMPNGSLEYHLFPGKSSATLDWPTRYQIALGTARGLAYLHEKCRDCIIHCDIKPENILLDAEFCPKVADFGLAKLVGREFSRVLTTMRGTRGYLAPEWISGVAITAKADVFSYGMVLFELLSGHRNIENSGNGAVKFFPTLVASKVAAEEDVMGILDPILDGNADTREVLKICKLACWCIQDNENHRPSTGQVVQILEGVLDINMPPMPRSLQIFDDHQDQITFYSESSSAQSSQTGKNSSVTKSSSSIASVASTT